MDLCPTLVWKIALSLGGRSFSLLLIKMGFSGGLALAISFALRALLTSEEISFVRDWMLPAGASGAEAHSEPHEPSAESSSAPEALDERKEELILENLAEKKGRSRRWTRGIRSASGSGKGFSHNKQRDAIRTSQTDGKRSEV
uniref:Orf142 n=1 Tax=Batis maritima TaxID=4436 RepID=A0A068BBP5_BATMA|nr:orf142 [Batis maritima]AIC83350.1 orf142 [Batis maritima]